MLDPVELHSSLPTCWAGGPKPIASGGVCCPSCRINDRRPDGTAVRDVSNRPMSDSDMSRDPNPERRDAAGSRMGRMATWVGVVLVLAVAALGLRWHPWAREPERSEARDPVEGKRVAPEVQSQAEAAETERLRREAEARAKAEAEETALFSRMGLIVPLNPGALGKLGAVAVRWVPPGRFTMGSPASEKGREANETLHELQHEVTLSRGFFLAETECTQAQWESVMGNNPSASKGAERPVVQVQWGEVVTFCRKLTEQHRGQGLLPEGWAWRLPTEAEWEYAARAGTTGARYGDLDAIAWHYGNSPEQTRPVGGKQPNDWGLRDMIGNAAEWCADAYKGYTSLSVTDPYVPYFSPTRVFRGGGWYMDDNSCRAAYRDRLNPDVRVHNLGFRPALSPVR